MEIEIAAEHFIRTLAGEHHFDAHRFDFTRHQIHRRRSADGGDIVSFNVIDNIANRVQPFLYRKVDLVMHGTQMVSHFLRGFQVGGAFQPNGEGVQLRPPGF